jgi:hypothetical protein
MLFTIASPNKILTRLSEVSSWITLYFVAELKIYMTYDNNTRTVELKAVKHIK